MQWTRLENLSYLNVCRSNLSTAVSTVSGSVALGVEEMTGGEGEGEVGERSPLASSLNVPEVSRRERLFTALGSTGPKAAHAKSLAQKSR